MTTTVFPPAPEPQLFRVLGTFVAMSGGDTDLELVGALADALLEKFGGDSLGEVRRNLDAYLARLDERAG
jgi:hypothetical protein